MGELESHTGLFVQAGFEQFEFAHKSIHEYLCADYISRVAIEAIPVNKLVSMPSEVAVAISICPSPEHMMRAVRSYIHVTYIEERLKVSSAGLAAFWLSMLRRLRLELPDFKGNAITGFEVLACFNQVRLENPLIPGRGTIQSRTDLATELQPWLSIKGVRSGIVSFWSLYHSLVKSRYGVQLRIIPDIETSEEGAWLPHAWMIDRDIIHVLQTENLLTQKELGADGQAEDDC